MKYPDLPRPTVPYNFRISRPFIGGGPEWAPQNRDLTRFSLFEADLNYRGRSWADIMILHAFFESVDGPAGRFTFVDFNGIGVVGQPDPGVAWKNLFVAKGDDSATVFDLPAYGIDLNYGIDILENGNVEAVSDSGTPSAVSGVTYHTQLGAGVDGVDQIAGDIPVPAGVILSINATCRRALRRARFTTAKNPFVYNVPANYYQGPVTIVEVRK